MQAPESVHAILVQAAADAEGRYCTKVIDIARDEGYQHMEYLGNRIDMLFSDGVLRPHQEIIQDAKLLASPNLGIHNERELRVHMHRRAERFANQCKVNMLRQLEGEGFAFRRAFRKSVYKCFKKALERPILTAVGIRLSY